ncbi:nuclear respiratory factor 1 isoform X9 [Tympanuchus pallidicinctus]|nr:nuclear respiratory factor 1 isoform X9 [Tympanuchus pallidicinctus]
MAAAAAVATGKKRKRPHVFESNPSIRKRQQTRLLRKLRATLDEYTTRVGQQAIVLCISPSKPNPVFKVFGAAPLENVVRKYKSMILEDLESALAEHAPAPQEVNSELPPLTIDGIPVSVDKMTQAQLRAFIPEMLKYSTGRGKPGWGKESCKPIWWPEDIPWANVRSDVRTDEQKQRVSWTQALRTIVKNCYKQHGREDLLYAFEDQQTQQQTTTTHSIAHLVPSQTVVQTFSNPDGTVSLIQVGTGATVATLADASELPTTVTVAQVNYSAVADGEVEQNWATLQGGEMTIQTTQASEATQAVASLAEAAVAASQEMQQGATVTMALNSEAAAHAVATLAEATLQGGGQIVLSGETAAAVGALTGVQDANGILAADYSGYKWSLAESLSAKPADQGSLEGLFIKLSSLEHGKKGFPYTGRCMACSVSSLHLPHFSSSLGLAWLTVGTPVLACVGTALFLPGLAVELKSHHQEEGERQVTLYRAQGLKA